MNDSWKRTLRGRRSSDGGALLQPTLRIHADVIQHAAAEIRENPQIEVGGKFVGSIEGEFSPHDRDWRVGFNDLQVTVLGHLDAGPRRDRSAVHHYSDTDYQLRLFQRVAAEIPAVCFLGIWHSHHPNGLRELSGGDAQTGLRTVNSDGHELDLLLSSLAFDDDGLIGGRHYVFIRGHQIFYEIDPSRIQVIHDENPVTAAITRNASWLRAQAEQTALAPIGGSSPEQPQQDSQAPEGRPTGGAAQHGDVQHGAAQHGDAQRGGPQHGQARRGAAQRSEARQEVRRSSWFESPEGRAVLAFDVKWLRLYPSMLPSLRDEAVAWRGPVDVGSAVYSCAYFPSGRTGEPATAIISTADGATELRFGLADPRARAARFAAMLKAFSVMTTEADGLAERTFAASNQSAGL